MKYKRLKKTNQKVAVVGQGTMGIDDRDIKALKLGIELGMTFIDTAEGYGAGHSEELVGKAVKGMRNKVFISTKFSPEHSSYNNVLRAAEGSLKRLKTDYIDLYHVHWPNPSVSIEETMQAMEKLVSQGKIRYIGVSNFSLAQLKEAQRALSQNSIFSIQMEYNLFDHFIEDEILPYCEKEQIITIAYSPLDQGRIAPDKGGKLEAIARKYQKSISQMALNWLISHPTVIIIPKATEEKYIRENAETGDFKMSEDDFNKISELYARKPIYVPVDKIEVSTKGQGNRKVYQTVEQALANKLNFVPSPFDLGQYIRDHSQDNIKPIRLIHDKTGKREYSLVEGRVRYWAWVIAHKGRKPIPAYIRFS